LRARYYNQNTGGFTQMDTYAGNSQDPVTLHKYVYANGNPVSFVDPSGYMSNLAEASAAGNAGMSLQLVRITTVTFPRVAANDAMWAAAGSAGVSTAAAVGASSIYCFWKGISGACRAYVNIPLLVAA
jgi:hypothetical protein